MLQGRYVAADPSRLLRGLAARGPVVLVCEDLHWADPASHRRRPAAHAPRRPAPDPVRRGHARRDRLRRAGASSDHARELFGEALTEIRLEPLSEADSRTLVANLLEIESLPDGVRDLIMARAEGNPFFVEEVVRMLIERGVIVPQGDRWVATEEVECGRDPGDASTACCWRESTSCPTTAKRSLRVAAVIGRQFPVRVLERVDRRGASR